MSELLSHQETQIFLSAAEEISQIGCFSWDFATDALSWSDGLFRIYGIERADFSGTLDSFYERLHPADRDKVAAAVQAAVHNGGRFASNERIIRPNGEIRWLDSRGRVIFDDAQRAVRLDGVCRDITDSRRRSKALQREISDRRAAEEKLQQAQKVEAIGRLTSGVAHDFNNLLTIVISNAQLLENQFGDMQPAAVTERLTSIREAGERAAQLTQQLLLFSRASTSLPQVVDANAAVEEACAFLERTLGKHIRIETSLDTHVVAVSIDPTHLQQTLLNLALNARDAMPRGGVLTIATRFMPGDAQSSLSLPITAGDRVVLEVTDTGHGLSEEVKSRMFDPFFTTRQADSGIGLGLSVVYGIVKSADGVITADSTPGQGTCMRISLPACTAATVPAPPASHPRIESAAECSIVIVEDEPAVLQVLSSALRLAGYRVQGFGDPLEACRFLTESRAEVHLVIVDVSMPAMTGPELVTTLHNARGDTAFPALYISGNDRNVLENIHGLSIDDARFLQKPFRIEDLLSKVQALACATRTPAAVDDTQRNA